MRTKWNGVVTSPWVIYRSSGSCYETGAIFCLWIIIILNERADKIYISDLDSWWAVLVKHKDFSTIKLASTQWILSRADKYFICKIRGTCCKFRWIIKGIIYFLYHFYWQGRNRILQKKNLKGIYFKI